MTVFLTPEGEPFYGGTYFPPADRHGLPGFPRLLASLADAWATRRGEVLSSARHIGEPLGQGEPLPGAARLLTPQALLPAPPSASSPLAHPPLRPTPPPP